MIFGGKNLIVLNKKNIKDIFMRKYLVTHDKSLNRIGFSGLKFNFINLL